MKYIKTFENNIWDKRAQINYDVGDIVISQSLDKYKVLKIYVDSNSPLKGLVKKGIIKNHTNQPYMLVDIENIETGDILKNQRSDIFRLEAEANANKFNL
jgi:hypothetical protein